VTSLHGALFQPHQIGGLRLRNRIFVSAHTTNFGVDNLPTERHVAYHRARARGGVGLIVTEAIRVHPTSAGRASTLAGWSSALAPRLAGVVDAVHHEGTAIFAQLIHAGRQAGGHTSRVPAWGASDQPWTAGAAVPHVMTETELAVTVEAFAAAATRVAAAGVDGVEVHVGHGHLLQQFLSPVTNQRSDAWGGSPANRLRLTRDTLLAVRAVLPAGTALGVRISADEFLPGGLGPDEMVAAVAALRADVALDFLDVSHSAYVGSWSLATQIADMTFPAAPFRSFAARFKAAFPDVTVLAACRLDDPDIASDMVGAGETDLVAMTRAHIADPDLAGKLAAGRGEEIRSCIACNQACIGRVELNLPISCVVNPEVGLEDEWARWQTSHSAAPPSSAARGRDVVLVVGAGPAGLQAALTARRRGLDVMVADAGTEPGGALRMAARLGGRGRIRRLTDELARDVRAAGVSLECGLQVEADLVTRGSWAAVIVATGGCYDQETEPGWAKVHTAAEVATGIGPGPAGPGFGPAWSRVAVIDDDGGWAGAGLAAHLAEAGAEVTLLTPTGSPAWRVTTYSRLALSQRLITAGVRMRTLVAPVAWDGRMLTVSEPGGFRESMAVDAVIRAALPRSDDRLTRALSTAGYDRPVITVGDAYAPRSAFEAVWDGRLAGASVLAADATELDGLRALI
jgi:2,4-dienoyl-CoA reductase-like NADH-dependent reductase (Old Yellow Enzyme family)